MGELVVCANRISTRGVLTKSAPTCDITPSSRPSQDQTSTMVTPNGSASPGPKKDETQTEQDSPRHQLQQVRKASANATELTNNFSPTNDQDYSNSGNCHVREEPLVKPTGKRYIILYLMALNLANKAFQWIQLPASTKKLTYLYNVENFVINASSVAFMLPYIVLSVPACCMIEHLGIRRSVLLASFGAALGAILKCFSCHEGGIYLLFAGQVIVALSEQMIFSVPSRLASVWFPDHQVSSAVAICVLGNQFGAAFGFLATEFLLQSAETKDEIGQGLYWIFLCTAIVSVVSFMFDYWLFDEAPMKAPGLARFRQIQEEEARTAAGKRSFFHEMATMLKMIIKLIGQRSFNLLWVSYGINVGVGYTIATVLNQVLEQIWPGDDILIGNTGFIIILFGALLLPIWGRLFDWMHRYQAINVFLTLATILTLMMFGYAVSFTQSVVAVYMAAALYGAFQTGLVVGGLELAVELTYPAPELVTSTLMNIMPQICGSIFVFAASYIMDNYGALWTHTFYVAVIIVALILLVNIRETLNRQNAVAEREKFKLKSLVSEGFNGA